MQTKQTRNLKFFLQTTKEHREYVGHHEKTHTLSDRSDDGEEHKVKRKDLKFPKRSEEKGTVVIQEAEHKTDSVT